MSIQECRDTNILPPETKETGEQHYHNDNNTQCYSESSDYHIPLSQTPSLQTEISKYQNSESSAESFRYRKTYGQITNQLLISDINQSLPTVSIKI
ncbi:hypothetical protein EB796_023011 [Bugula neritina]|uniref:Uncharacterized protein n=1 Tax=Bugula neritina TaxID=10212 RepID=A0A7J7IZ08_BUGNE|nr:hypothetical protein EB796_023011 [Bugula neritina]